MSNTKVVRNELSKYAQQIENLAHEVQTKLAAGDDIMAVANELARNSSTFVFVYGELSALTSKSTGKTVKATTVSNPAGTKNRNYTNNYNVRDPATGRFVRV